MACITFRHCRYDIAEFSLSQLHRAVTLQSGALAVLVYWATLLLRYRPQVGPDSLHQRQTLY